MLKALLLGSALTIAAAAPSLAQSTPPTQPGTTQQRQTAPPATTQPRTQQGTTPARIEGSHLIGLTLRNSADESIGSIDDVIVGRDGRVRQVVVSVGGFLGIGDRKVAIGWDQLRFDANRDVAVVNLTKDQLRAMPEYRARDAMQNNTAPSPATGVAPGVAAPGTAPRAPTNPAPATRQP
jgi:hypothetical protein